MRILTWNINGLRAGTGKPGLSSSVSNVHAAGSALKATLDGLTADIICLQETKVTRDQLEESIALIKGYESFFSFSRVKAGYSGVATYCRAGCVPVRAEEGLTPVHHPAGQDAVGHYGELEHWSEADQLSVDGEGRTVLTEHRIGATCCGESSAATTSVVLINVYCPRASLDEVQRYEYKMTFYRALEVRCRALRAAGKHVIVLGDVNCSHRQIDVCDSDDCNPEDFNSRPSRQWLDALIIDSHADMSSSAPCVSESNSTAEAATCSTGGQDQRADNDDTIACSEDADTCSGQGASPGLLVDSFRHYHPARPDAYTCWSTVTGARKTNFGTRIDYILVDKPFMDVYAASGDIMPEVEGSDHCPVYLEVQECIVPSPTLPSLAASKMPEFSGKQQSMMAYVKRISSESSTSSSHAGVPTATNLSVSSASSDSSSRQPVAQLKRSSSSLSSSSSQQDRKRVCSGRQQTSIAGFFQRKTPSAPASSSDSGTSGTYSAAITPSNDGKPVDDCPSANVARSADVPSESKASSSDAGNQWKSLFTSRAPKPVLCRGHQEPCVLQTVKKSGPNQFRKFYVCARPSGAKDNPLARCEHFEWLDKPKFKTKTATVTKS